MSAWSRSARRTIATPSTSTSSPRSLRAWPCSRPWSNAARHDRQCLVGRRPAALPRSGGLPLVEGGAVGIHRVHLFPPGPQGGPRPSRLSGLHGHRARAACARTWSAPSSPDDDPQRRRSITPDPGRGRRTRARDQRVRSDRRRHGLPLRDAPDLSPSPPQLVGRLVRSARTRQVTGRSTLGNCRRVAVRTVSHRHPPERTTRDRSIVSVPAREGRAAVGGTTCISRSTTTSF